MEPEIITQEPLPSVPDVSTQDGGGARSQEAVGLAELLSAQLGKQFPTDEAALKAVKDTFAYVGKVGQVAPVLEKLKTRFGGEPQVLKFMEQIAEQGVQPQTSPEILEKVNSLEATVKESTFYAEHPDLVPFKEQIKALGTNPAEVYADEGKKKIIDSLMAYDQVEKSKSVLHTNPRIGQATDKISQAQELQATNPAQASSLAVQAVMEAFEPNFK